MLATPVRQSSTSDMLLCMLLRAAMHAKSERRRTNRRTQHAVQPVGRRLNGRGTHPSCPVSPDVVKKRLRQQMIIWLHFWHRSLRKKIADTTDWFEGFQHPSSDNYFWVHLRVIQWWQVSPVEGFGCTFVRPMSRLALLFWSFRTV